MADILVDQSITAALVRELKESVTISLSEGKI